MRNWKMQIFRWFFDDLSRKRRSEPIWISKKLWPAGVWFARKKSFFVVGISFPVARMSLLHACIILLVWVNTKIECRGQNCVLFWLDFVTNPRISCRALLRLIIRGMWNWKMQIFMMKFWWFIKKKALRAHFYLRNVATDRCMVRKEEIIFSGRYFIFSHPKVSSTRVYNLIGMV